MTTTPARGERFARRALSDLRARVNAARAEAAANGIQDLFVADSRRAAEFCSRRGVGVLTYLLGVS